MTLVALVIPLAAACTGENHDGVVSDAEPAQVDGTQLWAQLPTGRVTVTVGKAVRTIPGDEVVGGKPVEADSGREFLPVAVVYDDLVGVPYDAPQAEVSPEKETDLALHVGDRSYRIPFDRDTTRSYIELPSSTGGDVSLDVAFDGVSQSVDAAGRRDLGEAAGLYDASTRMELQSCGGEEGSRLDGGDRSWLRTCRYNLWEYPYVEGLGWASKREPGTTWVVATAQTWLRADQLDADGMTCRPAAMGGSILVRVDGRSSTQELPVQANNLGNGHGLGAKEAFLLAPADQHDLEVTSTWGCRLGDRSADRKFVDRVKAPS